MKKLFLISAIALSSLFYNSANAQIRLHFGVRFGLPRIYVPARVVANAPGPVAYNEPVNYNGGEDYYYLPDVDAYYSLTDQCYFYNDGGSWVSAAYLPGAYSDYDWRNVRHYEVRAPRPYLHNDFYRTKFNGANFNGQWNRRNDRGYANNNRDGQFRTNEQRPDDGVRGGFNRNEQHFSQNNFHSREGFARGDSRHGRS